VFYRTCDKRHKRPSYYLLNRLLDVFLYHSVGYEMNEIILPERSGERIRRQEWKAIRIKGNFLGLIAKIIQDPEIFEKTKNVMAVDVGAVNVNPNEVTVFYDDNKKG